MTTRSSNSRGADLVARLNRGIRQLERAARPGARQLPVVHGVTPQCQFTHPAENVISDVRSLLLDSEVVYQYADGVVLERREAARPSLAPLSTQSRVETSASALMANVFLCEMPSMSDDRPPIQFPPPQRLVELILMNQPTLDSLPKIRTYARRPVFDTDFVLREPGWHPDIGVLVHGPVIEPTMWRPGQSADSEGGSLPPHLTELLRGFCFRDVADRTNAVALLLTGLLVSHFIRPGKPVGLFDGNQPGIGKTLLARVLGIVLDGCDPETIHFTPDDEELGKRICAALRGQQQSLLLIDNAKVRNGGQVSSTVLEANSTAPVVSLRILGRSENYSRPNDLLWLLTMNLTKTSPDLVSRGLPVRFRFEGDPGRRQFTGDPLDYAHSHRIAILSELAGLVYHWTSVGRPSGVARHRCRHWAEVIGGILQANNIAGFLENLDDAVGEFDTAVDDLAILAELAVTTLPAMVRERPRNSNTENS